MTASRPFTRSISDTCLLWCRHGAVAASIALAGCGGGTDNSAISTPDDNRPVGESDLEIAQLLYADNRRTPQNFYQETPPPVQGYVATTHLKNTDISGTTNAPQYELCTDDWNNALAWSDQVASVSQSSNLVATDTTMRYYEFDRVRTGTPQGYIRARVYRCSYLDRSNVDLLGNGSTAGQLNQRPLTASELQQLTEYLWQFTPYNNYGNAVLKSTGATTSSGLQHTLIIASLATATNSGCDHIRIVGWTHNADQSGALRLDVQSLWDFGAHRVAGIVETCNPN